MSRVTRILPPRAGGAARPTATKTPARQKAEATPRRQRRLAGGVGTLPIRPPGFLQRSIPTASATSGPSARRVPLPAPRRPLRQIIDNLPRPAALSQRRGPVVARDGMLMQPSAAYQTGNDDDDAAAVEPAARLLGNVDLWLLLTVVLLVTLGTVMVYSASMYTVYLSVGVNYYLSRQIMWVGVGIVALFAGARINYQRWGDIALFALGITLLLLVLVHVSHFGVSLNGAQRWLQLPHLPEIQPSEVAKLGLLIYVSYWLATTDERNRRSLLGLLPLTLVCAIVLWLIIKQPDLGTTLIIGLSLFMTFFLSGAALRHIGLILAVLTGGGYYFAHYLAQHSTSYWAARLLTFENPFQDPMRNGFQIVQSLYALGSGGMTGVGLGQSIVKYIIPAAQTDSIFAILGEELGLVGTLLVMGLFMLFAARGMAASMRAHDMFGRLLAAGITSSIVFQALINMGVVAHLIPDTGVPLPFISFGGSSLAISMFGAGILLNISKQGRKVSLLHAHDNATPTAAPPTARADRRRGNWRSPVPGPGSAPIPLRAPRRTSAAGAGNLRIVPTHRDTSGR